MSWKIAKLSEVCSKIGSGATPKGGSTVYIEKGTALIRSQNVYNLSFDYNGLVYINDEAAKKLNGVTIEENDVLINAGEATIEGLDADTYYLEEVTAPTGYNKLTSKVEVIISKVGSNNTFSRFTAEVLNYTGSKLPETGGMGTTLFLTFGSILVIGFGLLLVTKLRVYKENI